MLIAIFDTYLQTFKDLIKDFIYSQFNKIFNKNKLSFYWKTLCVNLIIMAIIYTSILNIGDRNI